MKKWQTVVTLIASGAGAALLVLWWSKRKSKPRTLKKRNTLVPVVNSNIHIARTGTEWQALFPIIQNDLAVYKVMGFDCEWVNTETRRNRPVSVLQLATCSGLCILVREELLRNCPITLTQILSDKSILKAGVACLHDAKKLNQDHNLEVRGCVDLRHIAVRSRLQRIGGLAALSESVLGFEMDKDYAIRVGNWETEPLSQRQMVYAATDAAVGLEIFLCLIEKKYISLPRHCEFWQTASAMCQGIVDLGFSSRRAEQITTTPGKYNPAKKTVPIEQILTRAYSSRKKPLYHNCQLWAPDGQLLCTCDVKKALWYVEKGLGEKVCEDPLTIKLLFEPSGRPMEEKNYYLQDKENICVVCGSEDSYIRKNIVPHEYRKYFPPMMKEHKSHDIVLMCLPCHQRSGSHDAAIKQELETRCNAPSSTENGRKYNDDQFLVKVRSASKALLLSSDKLPPRRKTELQEIVCDYFGVKEMSHELLSEGAEMDVKIRNNKFSAHGENVVKYMMENDGLVVFERMWRQHFLDTMEPKFLPALWSVDHCHDELQSMDADIKQIIGAQKE